MNFLQNVLRHLVHSILKVNPPSLVSQQQSLHPSCQLSLANLVTKESSSSASKPGTLETLRIHQKYSRKSFSRRKKMSRQLILS